jgi:ribosomal protein S18 acetylase RimI-like enzyme
LFFFSIYKNKWLNLSLIFYVIYLPGNFKLRTTMILFTNSNINIAHTSDIPYLGALLNSAYRGESSRRGWTTEADIIAGDIRTNDEDLLGIMCVPGSVFLKYQNDKKEIIGCVNLQRQGAKLYLGMFSVSPLLQGGGIGRQILLAAEEYARQLEITLVFMTVISLRTELIDWYKRNGYAETGQRKAFEEDGLTGKHLQRLEFIYLEKQIAQQQQGRE